MDHERTDQVTNFSLAVLNNLEIGLQQVDYRMEFAELEKCKNQAWKRFEGMVEKGV